ncbi:hypothetical protein [Psychrobacter sp. I-STPA10]|uniref:hypothetical protein n=1 Tax=Psychrobacter sp. I-STPA10 TaxID=2585769 RepID=UPI001E645556|nr:hypothetical protein [Psychrobacter sp. I-STPA10]
MYVNVEKVFENEDIAIYRFYNGSSTKDGIFALRKYELENIDFERTFLLIEDIGHNAKKSLYKRAMVAVGKSYRKDNILPEKASFASG